MAFIDNIKFKEILKAAREGNEKAKMVLQAMRKNSAQEDVDRLVEGYYHIDEPQPIDNPEPPQPSEDIPPELNPDEIAEPEAETDVVSMDLNDILDKETADLFDEIDVDDVSFNDFLKTKRRDALRARKNADYFKAFDSDGRKNYMTNKIDSYKKKFNGRLEDILRRFNDNNIALTKYAQAVNDALDDEVEIDSTKVLSAYNDFLDDEDTMRSFGRHWDNKDNEIIVYVLNELIQKYGKQNVMAAINTLKSDNEGYRDFMNNQIDANIGKYSKNIESLLK